MKIILIGSYKKVVNPIRTGKLVRSLQVWGSLLKYLNERTYLNKLYYLKYMESVP